jgi:hypothetical protein
MISYCTSPGGRCRIPYLSWRGDGTHTTLTRHFTARSATENLIYGTESLMDGRDAMDLE